MTDNKTPADLPSDADAKYFAQLTDEVSEFTDVLLAKVDGTKDPYFAARTLIWNLTERSPQLFSPQLLRNCADKCEHQSQLVTEVFGDGQEN